MVHLSNSGPAISGSQIVFKAEVSDGTSHPVQDEKYLEYSWENTADGLKVCQYCRLKGVMGIVRDNFPYFSIKAYLVTPH